MLFCDASGLRVNMGDIVQSLWATPLCIIFLCHHSAATIVCVALLVLRQCAFLCKTFHGRFQDNLFLRYTANTKSSCSYHFPQAKCSFLPSTPYLLKFYLQEELPQWLYPEFTPLKPGLGKWDQCLVFTQQQTLTAYTLISQNCPLLWNFSSVCLQVVGFLVCQNILVEQRSWCGLKLMAKENKVCTKCTCF